MALIDIVRKAQSLGPAHGQAAGVFGLQPEWLADIELQPQEEEDDVELVKRQPVPASLDSINLKIQKEQKLVEELSQVPDKEITLEVLDQRLRPYLEQVPDPPPNAKTKKNAKHSLYKLLRKSAPFIGHKLISWIIKAVVVSHNWDIVKALLEDHVVKGNSYPELVSAMIEQNQIYLLCLWLKNVEDPRFSDVLSVLKYLLKSTLNSGKQLSVVRKEWKKSALQAINYLSKKHDKSTSESKLNESDVAIWMDVDKGTHMKKSVTQDNDMAKAVLLGLAFDQFHPFELCLHLILVKRLDEAVLASIISELDGTEAFKVLRYLSKWISKYSKHSAVSMIKEEIANEAMVPSLQEVMKWISVVLDTHLMTVILCKDFHQELKLIQSSINDMANLSRAFAPLAGIVEHLRSNGPLPKKQASDGEDDHIIEYLEI